MVWQLALYVGRGKERNITPLCRASSNGNEAIPDDNLENPVVSSSCLPQRCASEANFEYMSTLPDQCLCAAPFSVEIRLRSPSICQFPPYLDDFRQLITQSISLCKYQFYVDSILWEAGPRLKMSLLFFPDLKISTVINSSEVQRIANAFTPF